jgi:hypothetical protein
MTVADILHAIRDLGFPIVVAVYLLVRLDSLLSQLVAHEQREADTLDRIEHYLNPQPTPEKRVVPITR